MIRKKHFISRVVCVVTLYFFSGFAHSNYDNLIETSVLVFGISSDATREFEFGEQTSLQLPGLLLSTSVQDDSESKYLRLIFDDGVSIQTIEQDADLGAPSFTIVTTTSRNDTVLLSGQNLTDSVGLVISVAIDRIFNGDVKVLLRDGDEQGNNGLGFNDQEITIASVNEPDLDSEIADAESALSVAQGELSDAQSTLNEAALAGDLAAVQLADAVRRLAQIEVDNAQFWLASLVELVDDPPIAEAGNDLIFYDDETPGISLKLLGSNSEDDFGLVDYYWVGSDGGEYFVADPEVTAPVGTTTYTLTVTDSAGHRNTDSVSITVEPYMATVIDDVHEPATYDPATQILTIPQVAVDDVIKRYELRLVPGTDPIEFELYLSSTLPVFSAVGPSDNNGLLDIPLLTFENQNYEVQLQQSSGSFTLPKYQLLSAELTQIVSDTARILGSDTASTLDFRTSSDNQLNFPSGNNLIDALSVGDILIAGQSESTPNGLLKKVVSIQKEDGNVAIQTENAALTDVIEKAAVNLSGDLDPGTGTANRLSTGQGNPIPNTGVITEFALDGVKLILPKENAVAYFDDCEGAYNFRVAVESELTSGVSVNGCIAFSLTYDFEIDIEDRKLQELLFAIHSNISAELSMTTSLVDIDLDEEVVLATYRLPTIRFFIGLVPVFVVPVIDIVLGTNGQISASITTGSTSDLSATSGIQYSDGIWVPINNRNSEFDFIPPTLDAQADATVYAGPKAYFLLYGIAGPNAGIQGYLTLHADIDEDPWWFLYGGIRAGAGATIELFDRTISDFYDPDIIDFEIELARAGGSFYVPDLHVSTRHSGSLSVQQGKRFTLSMLVSNSGGGSSGSTTLDYYRSSNSTIDSRNDTWIGDDHVDSLNSGANSYESISLTAPSAIGSYYYGACVRAVAEESDVTNQCSAGTRVYVRQASEPDLTVSQFTATPSAVEEGGEIELAAVVKNSGNASSNSSTIRFYMSTDRNIDSRVDDFIGSATISALGAGGQTGNTSISYELPNVPGQYYFGACVDSVANEEVTTNQCSSGILVTAYELYLGSVTVSDSNDIDLEIWDYSAEDGDRINVYLNDTLVLSNITLVNARQNTSLQLNSGSNVLAIEALNTGTSGPNTAAFEISNVIQGSNGGTYQLYTGEIAVLEVIAP